MHFAIRRSGRYNYFYTKSFIFNFQALNQTSKRLFECVRTPAGLGHFGKVGLLFRSTIDQVMLSNQEWGGEERKCTNLGLKFRQEPRQEYPTGHQES